VTETPDQERRTEEDGGETEGQTKEAGEEKPKLDPMKSPRSQQGR
jgi:hypothetical protein